MRKTFFCIFFCKKWVTSQATCARVWNEARMLESHTECVRLVGSGLLHGDGLGLWTVWQRVWIGWRDPTEFMNAANIARRRAIINLRPQDIRKKTSLSVQHQCLISLQANDAYHCVLVCSSSARVGRGNEWEDNGLTRQSIISAATLTTKHGKYWEKHARNAYRIPHDDLDRVMSDDDKNTPKKDPEKSKTECSSPVRIVHTTMHV